MTDPTIEALQNRCDQLEDMINGLCAYLAIQAKKHGWDEIDTDDEAIKKVLRPMLLPVRRLQKSGVMADAGFFAAIAINKVEEATKLVP